MAKRQIINRTPSVVEKLQETMVTAAPEVDPNMVQQEGEARA